MGYGDSHLKHLRHLIAAISTGFRRWQSISLISATGLLVGLIPVAVPAYEITNYAIEEPLTSEAGDPERGLAAMVDRKAGNCLGCHAAPIDAEFFGTTGPTLAGVGARLTPGQIRLRLVNPKELNPMTMMPAYFRSEGFHRVLPGFEDKSILTAQQIEDIVAYLVTLK